MTRRGRLLLLLVALCAVVFTTAVSRPVSLARRLDGAGFPRAAERVLIGYVEGAPTGDGRYAVLEGFMRDRGRKPRLAEMLRDFEERYPHAGAPSFRLGFVLASVGDVDGAVAAYRRAIARGAPNAATAWNNIGYELAKVGRYEEAHEALDAAERLLPDSAFPVMNRALALARAGRDAEALAIVREAEARYADARDEAGVYWAKRAVIEDLAGDREAALDSFRLARERGRRVRRFIEGDPSGKSLSEDPRYVRIREETSRRRRGPADRAP